MIQPTVGRVVWYYGGPDDRSPGQHYAALITHVWTDRKVNLCVFRPDGVPEPKVGVYLFQGDVARPSCNFCEWMPYQKGQAAKTEALEKTLAEPVTGPGERDKGDLRRLIMDALKLATGGFHANSACPMTTDGDRDHMVSVVTHLSQALRYVYGMPEFIVCDGSARRM